MSDYIQIPNEEKEADVLLEEFESLILSISKEIIDKTIIDDLNILRKDLKTEMTTFSDQASNISSITSKIDNLLTQTTINMSAAVSKTTEEMSVFLENTSELLDDRFQSILNQLDVMLEKNNALIEDKFTNASSGFDEMIQNINKDIFDSVDTTKDELKLLLEESIIEMNKVTVDVDQVVMSITPKINESLANNKNELKNILDNAKNQMDHMINNTTESFGDEIKMIQDYLINSDKLIQNNQKTIADIQRGIEEKLNGTLVQMVDLTNDSREQLSTLHTSIKELVLNMKSEVFALRELNNTINIKIDHGLTKFKEQNTKNDKRFKLLMIMNGSTIGVVLISIVIMLLRG